MPGERTHVEFVTESSVRSDVVRAVRDESRSVSALLDTVSASESAVYEAVSELCERGLLVDDGELGLTGIGDIVTDELSRLDDTDTLLSNDPEYWQSHRVSVLPDRFRASLSTLTGCEIVRATETDPHRAVRTVARRLEATTDAAIATPIYQDEYAMQLPDVTDLRLLLDAAILEDAAAIDGGIEPPESSTVRVGDIGFALTVTDDAVMLSLPKLDGTYDTRSELIAEHDAALDWGRRLYDYCWDRARPVDAVSD